MKSIEFCEDINKLILELEELNKKDRNVDDHESNITYDLIDLNFDNLEQSDSRNTECENVEQSHFPAEEGGKISDKPCATTVTIQNKKFNNKDTILEGTTIGSDENEIRKKLNNFSEDEKVEENGDVEEKNENQKEAPSELEEAITEEKNIAEKKNDCICPLCSFCYPLSNLSSCVDNWEDLIFENKDDLKIDLDIKNCARCKFCCDTKKASTSPSTIFTAKNREKPNDANETMLLKTVYLPMRLRNYMMRITVSEDIYQSQLFSANKQSNNYELNARKTWLELPIELETFASLLPYSIKGKYIPNIELSPLQISFPSGNNIISYCKQMFVNDNLNEIPSMGYIGFQLMHLSNSASRNCLDILLNTDDFESQIFIKKLLKVLVREKIISFNDGNNITFDFKKLLTGIYPNYGKNRVSNVAYAEEADNAVQDMNYINIFEIFPILMQTTVGYMENSSLNYTRQAGSDFLVNNKNISEMILNYEVLKQRVYNALGNAHLGGYGDTMNFPSGLMTNSASCSEANASNSFTSGKSLCMIKQKPCLFESIVTNKNIKRSHSKYMDLSSCRLDKLFLSNYSARGIQENVLNANNAMEQNCSDLTIMKNFKNNSQVTKSENENQTEGFKEQLNNIQNSYDYILKIINDRAIENNQKDCIGSNGSDSKERAIIKANNLESMEVMPKEYGDMRERDVEKDLPVQSKKKRKWRNFLKFFRPNKSGKEEKEIKKSGKEEKETKKSGEEEKETKKSGKEVKERKKSKKEVKEIKKSEKELKETKKSEENCSEERPIEKVKQREKLAEEKIFLDKPNLKKDDINPDICDEPKIPYKKGKRSWPRFFRRKGP